MSTHRAGGRSWDSRSKLDGKWIAEGKGEGAARRRRRADRIIWTSEACVKGRTCVGMFVRGFCIAESTVKVAPQVYKTCPSMGRTGLFMRGRTAQAMRLIARSDPRPRSSCRQNQAPGRARDQRDSAKRGIGGTWNSRSSARGCDANGDGRRGVSAA